MSDDVVGDGEGQLKRAQTLLTAQIALLTKTGSCALHLIQSTVFLKEKSANRLGHMTFGDGPEARSINCKRALSPLKT